MVWLDNFVMSTSNMAAFVAPCGCELDHNIAIYHRQGFHTINQSRAGFTRQATEPCVANAIAASDLLQGKNLSK